MLGTEEHGRWLIAPGSPIRATRRRYRGGTTVLDTEFDTDEGTVRLIDFMPVRDEAMDVVRIVEGVRGRVPMRMDLRLRLCTPEKLAHPGHGIPDGLAASRPKYR